MNKTLRNLIVDHLIKKGNYSPDVDDYVIDLLLDNIKFAEEAKAGIETRGLLETFVGRNGVSYTKMNPAFGIYRMCLANIHQCSNKLGISRNDRLKLKLLEEKTRDQFDEDFN